MVYWDTSAILKPYVEEADSSKFRQLMLDQTEHGVVSFLHDTEVYFALCGKEQRGEIGQGSAANIGEEFAEFMENHMFVQPINAAVRIEARRMADLCLQQVPPMTIRSLDGLHLAAVVVSGAKTLVTADRRMQEVARLLKIQVLPESES